MHVRELKWIDPIAAMRCFVHRPHLTFFDSAARHETLGRDPFGTYAVVDGRARWNGQVLEGDPWQSLEGLLAQYPQEHRADLPPFQGGAAGYLGYDLNRTLERLPAPASPGQRLPQAILHFYDALVSFDHRDVRCWIVSTGWPEQDVARRQERAGRRAAEIAVLLAGPKWHLNAFTEPNWRMAFQLQPGRLCCCRKARHRADLGWRRLPGQYRNASAPCRPHLIR